MVLLIYLFMILGIVFIAIGVFSEPRMKVQKIEGLHPEDHARAFKLRPVLSKMFPFTRMLLERLRWDQKIRFKLDAAHLKLSAVELFNLKILFIIALEIMVFIVMGKLEMPVFAITLVVGYIAPDIWLNTQIAKRKYAIARVLPETVDLLGLCVEAGLDFTTAVKWIIEKKITNNPMIEELAFVAEEIKWGKPRAQALKDMSKRLQIMEVSSFVQTLVQAERMGTPVAEAFSILSEDTRIQRYNRGERFAMKAPIKILIPLIFCILPVIAIIVGGPIFLQFLQGGLTGGMNP